MSEVNHMKKYYLSPVMDLINLNTTDDIITISAGGANGEPMSPVNFEDLFNKL